MKIEVQEIKKGDNFLMVFKDSSKPMEYFIINRNNIRLVEALQEANIYILKIKGILPQGVFTFEFQNKEVFQNFSRFIVYGNY